MSSQEAHDRFCTYTPFASRSLCPTSPLAPPPGITAAAPLQQALYAPSSPPSPFANGAPLPQGRQQGHTHAHGLEPSASGSWSLMSGTTWQPFSGSEWTSPLFPPLLPDYAHGMPETLSRPQPQTQLQLKPKHPLPPASPSQSHAQHSTLQRAPEPAIDSSLPTASFHKPASMITEQVVIPLDRQKVYPSSSHGPSVGDLAAQIGAKTGTTMDMSVSKLSRQLCFLVKGKPEQVKEARRELLAKVATTTTIEMTIPRECRRHILGTGGKTLQALSTATRTKIRVPRAEENSDIITIIGDFESIELARKEIEAIVHEKTNRVTEKIHIDKLFHPFLYGVQHENLHSLMEATRTKIVFPGPADPPTQITITGDKESVASAIASLNAIYEECKQTTSVVSLAVKKNLHKFLIGQKGSTLQEIFAVTQCAIELPAPSDLSELVMIRGPNDCLVKGLALVMEKANSTHVESFALTETQLKYISLRERPRLRRIEEEHKGTHIVLSSRSLEIQGKKESVLRAKSELTTLVQHLEACHYERFTIPLSHHKHIIGRRGQNIARIQSEFGVDLIVPNELEHSEDVLLVGKDMQKIEAVRAELSRILKDLERFAEKDLAIERDYLPSVLRGRFLRDLLAKHDDLAIRVRDPKLEHHEGYTLSSFHEAQLPPNRAYILHLRAQRDALPRIAAQISDFIESLKRSREGGGNAQSHDTASFLLEKKWADAFKLPGALFHQLGAQHGVKISYESKDSLTHDTIHVEGSRSDVAAVKDRILKQATLGQTAVRLYFHVPTRHHSALVGGSNARNMKTLMKRYHVAITWSRSTAAQEDADMFCIEGSSVDAEAAKQELSSLLDYEMEHSQALKFSIPCEYLRFIVGKNGAVITEIRESTNTKIDIQSSDSADATICVEGSEHDILQARLQIQNIIENLQQTEMRNIVVPQKYHKLLIGPFGAKVKALMEKTNNRVRISFPKEGAPPSDLVVLRGPSEDLDTIEGSLRQSMQEIDTRVTIEERFPFENRGSILGPNGSHLKWLMELHAVDISLSSAEESTKSVLVAIQGAPQAAQQALEDIRGSLKEELPLVLNDAKLLRSLAFFYQMDRNVSAHRRLKSEFGCYLNGKSDTGPFFLYGPKAKLMAAKQYILDKVLVDRHLEQESCRVSEKINFPKSCHKFIVGKHGATLRSIIQKSGADIHVPASSDPSSLIVVSGSQKSVRLAVQLIEDKRGLDILSPRLLADGHGRN